MKQISILTLFLFFSFTTSLTGQTATEEATADTSTISEFTEAELMAMYQAYTDSIEGTLTFYADTTVTLGDGLAALTIPEGYRYIGPDDSHTVLVDLWGNPPYASEGSLGMLFPANANPSDPDSYGIDIFFEEEGYVKDDDAEDIDYDDLLRDMQADTDATNAERIELGYEAIDLVGWANPPYYDATNKRLHWAKELHFDGTEENTLNYHVLFLGRRGYLNMNVIGSMKDVDKVTADLPDIMPSVSFMEGHRYADFDASVDKVAAYGIGALIAGKVLAKTGILAAIGIFLLKAWKIVLIGVVAVGAGVRNLFKRS
ncbi:MAG: DUF2167 domain-containing protein [Bacteroidota bacterium]